jgi:PhzF family phenazine biosynthesis protein
MNLKIYIANAFAASRFGGNPAAVVPLQQWLPDALMQQIAAQNNLAETAFIVPQEKDHAIRWFTPTTEVALCGHATLASAHIFFDHLGYEGERIRFHSKSGPLQVLKRADGRLTLDFPADRPVPSTGSPLIEQGLKTRPVEVYQSAFDYLVILNSQQEIEALQPDFGLLTGLPARGVVVSAEGQEYWAARLGKTRLTAVQLSRRRGYLDCELDKDRVLMSGRAFTYLAGEIFI